MNTRDLIQELYFKGIEPLSMYEALLSSELHSDFTKSEAKIDSEIGGKFTCYDGYINGKNIFLEEGTLLKNITNTNKKIDVDFKHLKRCCEISEISNFINKNKDKYQMYISHNGNNLSGGQKQRIAIAKALYRNSDILIFDETTSEIDVKIEKKLLNNFSKHLKNKTIILVTHKTQKNNFFNKRFILTANKLKKIN